MTRPPFLDLSQALFLFLSLFPPAEYLNFADSPKLPSRDALSRDRASTDRASSADSICIGRASESSRGISSGNLLGPDVAKAQETDVVASSRLVSCRVVSSRWDANIVERRREEEREERKDDVARNQGGGCRMPKEVRRMP